MKAKYRGKIYTIVTSDKSRNFGEVPKTYKKVGIADIPEYRYRPYGDVFVNKRRDFIIEVYVDGNFYPYYWTMREAL